MGSILLKALGILLGVLASGYGLYEHLLIKFSKAAGIAQGSSLCKLGESVDCSKVLGSEYGEFLGVPLALWGLVFYLFLLPIIWIKPLNRTQRGQPEPQATEYLNLSALALLLSAGSILLSGYLFYISSSVLQVYCPVCLSMYLANLLVFAGLFWDGSQEGFLNRLAQGFLALISVPSRALGTDRVARKSRLVLVWAVISCVAGFLFWKALDRHFATLAESHSQLAESGISQPGAGTGKMTAAVEQWLKQPVLEVPIMEGASTEADFSKGAESISGTVGSLITIVEFADLQCGACAYFFAVSVELLKRYPEKIRFVFKNYPLDGECNPKLGQGGHKGSCYLAQLARCAGEQGRFWETIQEIFTGSAEPQESFEQFIDALGAKYQLKKEELLACLDSNRHAAKLSADVALGDALQITGTPLVLLNGRKVEQPTLPRLSEIIDYVAAKESDLLAGAASK